MTNTFELDMVQYIHEQIVNDCEVYSLDYILTEIIDEYRTLYRTQIDEALKQYGADVVALAFDYMETNDTEREPYKIVEYAVDHVIDKNYLELEKFYGNMVKQLQKGEQ